LVDFYPAVDAFGAFQVTKFRAFVKWENLTRFILGDQLFFLSSYYPVPPSTGFRIGLKWFFAD
jgi:Putative porin